MNSFRLLNAVIGARRFRTYLLASAMPVLLTFAGSSCQGALIGLQYLVVGGGGGGGAGAPSSNNGGGGGAGGVLMGSTNLNPGTYTIVVGAGGIGGTNPDVIQFRSTSGGNSQFDTFIAMGGGAGAGGSNGSPASSTFNYPALSGGSGGGGAVAFQTAGASGTLGQGFAGGNGRFPFGNPFEAGGGGGAGEAGNTDGFGFGGDGVSSSITGSALVYGGGGSGGMDSSPILGGDGGGGSGGQGAGLPFAATAGMNGFGGGGGGGASQGISLPGANGGSGIVMLRYLLDPDFDQATGGLESIINVGGMDYVLHTFDGVGEFQFVVNAPVPEPSSLMLLGLGALALMRTSRRHSRRA